MVDTHIFLPGKMRRKRATNRRLSFSAKKLLFLRGRAAKAPQGADSRTKKKRPLYSDFENSAEFIAAPKRGGKKRDGGGGKKQRKRNKQVKKVIICSRRLSERPRERRDTESATPPTKSVGFSRSTRKNLADR